MGLMEKLFGTSRTPPAREPVESLPAATNEPLVPRPRRRRRRVGRAEKKLKTLSMDDPERDRVKVLAEWQSRVERAREIREQWERKFKVELAEQYFLGEQQIQGSASSNPTFNHFRATVKTIRPNLIFTAPKFFLRGARGQESDDVEMRAAAGEGVLEAIGNQDQNLKRSASLALMQGFFRIGVLKICYDPTLEPNPRAGELLKDLNGQVRIDPLTGNPMTEPEEVVTDDIYRYEWVDAKTMLLPDEGPDQSKWTWIGEEVTVLLEDAKQDTRFPQSYRDQLVANVSKDREYGRASAKIRLRNEVEECLKYVELYDMRKKRLRIYADGQPFDDFLLDGPLPDGLEDHPYAILNLGDPVMGTDPLPWPMPETASWVSPQEELNTLSKLIVEGAKRSARKGIFRDGTFDDVDEAVKVLQNPDDMVFAKVMDLDGVKMLEVPDVNPSIWKSIPMMFEFWRVITGQTGARLAAPDADTATEATFVERAANLRDVDKQDAVQDWLATAGRKMLQLVQQTLTIELWIRLRGLGDTELLRFMERQLGAQRGELAVITKLAPFVRDILRERVGQEKWHAVSREDLTGEFEVTVVPGSSRPRNLDVERREWMEFLQVIGQFPQLLLSRELLRETAAKFEYVNDRMVDELFALAQTMMQAQNQVAGRNQGGTPNPGAGTGSTAGNPVTPAIVAGMGGGV